MAIEELAQRNSHAKYYLGSLHGRLLIYTKVELPINKELILPYFQLPLTNNLSSLFEERKNLYFPDLILLQLLFIDHISINLAD